MFRAGGFMAKARRRVSTRTVRKRRPRARKLHAIELALAGRAHDIRTPLTGILALGEAAVETVARNEHDVVLMDVALSGIDGIGVTRRIRALAPPAGRIPIIGLIGAHRDGRRRGREGGRHKRLSAEAASPAELNESAAGRCPGSSALDQSDDD
jgi:CheY-like chemotaxis protein